MSGHRRDRSLPPMGTSNDERHSGHVDVAMADPDCPFCNPEARERSAGAAPLDVETLRDALVNADRAIGVPVDEQIDHYTAMAIAVAAEYARLSGGTDR